MVFVLTEDAVLHVIELANAPREAIAEIPVATASDHGTKRIAAGVTGIRKSRWQRKKDPLMDILARVTEKCVPEQCGPLCPPRKHRPDRQEVELIAEGKKWVRFAAIMPTNIGFYSDPPVETVGSRSFPSAGVYTFIVKKRIPAKKLVFGIFLSVQDYSKRKDRKSQQQTSHANLLDCLDFDQ